jgi:hypothetical protein
MLDVLISKNRVRGRSGCLAPTNQPGLPVNAKAHGDPLIARGPEQSSLSNPYKIYFLFFLKTKKWIFLVKFILNLVFCARRTLHRRAQSFNGTATAVHAAATLIV